MSEHDLDLDRQHTRRRDDMEHPPLPDRLSRQEAATRAEAEGARVIGARYDRSSDEFEAVTESGDPLPAEPIARDLRNLLAENKAIKNPGSVDEDFVRRLGHDICLRPDLLEVGIKLAQFWKPGEQIDVEEIIGAWDYIEKRYEEDIATSAGAKKLIELGADSGNVVDLLVKDPRRVRIYARLIEAPVLVGYKIHLFNRFVDTGEQLPLGVVIGGARELIELHNKRMEGLEAGDPTAIQRHEDLLASSKFEAVLADIAAQVEADQEDRTDPGVL